MRNTEDNDDKFTIDYMPPPVDRNVPDYGGWIKFGCDNITNEKKIASALDKAGEFLTSMGNQIGGILQSQTETNKIFELLGLFFDHTQELNLALINNSEKMSAPEVSELFSSLKC